MTADVALVMGSDGATREWTYTAMSRGTLATHYYEVQRPAERDALGVHHSQEPSRSAEERTVSAWGRIEQKESVLDYPSRYTEAERQRIVDEGTGTAPTDARRDLLAHLGAPELHPDATWIDASLGIDRRLGQTPGTRLGAWLEDMGYSEGRILELIREAANVGDLTREMLQRPEPLTGRTIDGIRTLAADPLLRAATLEMDMEIEMDRALEMEIELAAATDLTPW